MDNIVSFHLDFSTLAATGASALRTQVLIEGGIEFDVEKRSVTNTPQSIRSIICAPTRLELIIDPASQFREYVETWRRQTQHWSSVTRMISHPAYVAIVEMGRSVIPFLLAELRDRPDHWFVALQLITGEDPVPAGSTFGEAVQAWLAWGRAKGYLH